MASSFRTITAAASLLGLLGIAGHAQQQPAQPAPQQQTPPDPQQPVFRTGINFVRVDVIITDKNGNQIADLQAADFDVIEDGKPQKIETFKLIKLDGGVSRRDERAGRADPHRLRRGIGGGARRRPAVRDFPRRLSRAPRREHVRPQSAHAVHRNAARAVGHDRRDVSARIDCVGPDDAQPRRRRPRPPAVPGPQVRLHAEEPVRREVRVLPDRESSRGSAIRCRCRRSSR